MAVLTTDTNTSIPVVVLVTSVSSRQASHLPAYFTALMTTLHEMTNTTMPDVGAASDDVMLIAQAGFKPWDNPDNLMDKHTSETIETVINVGILPPVVFVGVVTNLINIVVFAKQGLRDRINVCLFSLAMADCCYLLALFGHTSFSLLGLISRPLGAYWQVRSLNTIIAVFWGFSSISNLLTMLVALERCLCVVSPFRAKQLLKTKVVVILVILVYVLVMAGSLTFNAKFDVGTAVVNADTNATMYVAVFSQFYIENRLAIDIIYNYLLAISIPFISLVVVIISTSITVVFLRRAFTWKQTSANITAADTVEMVVTKMLLMVCYVYVVCISPSVLSAFLLQFVEGWEPTGPYANTFFAYVSLMHMLSAFNSSANFFIYYARGSKFRATLRELRCWGRSKPVSGSAVENATSVTSEGKRSVSSDQQENSPQRSVRSIRYAAKKV